MHTLTRFVLAVLFLSVCSIPLYSQSACRIAMDGLQGSYMGECRKGKAHGEGVAEGTLGAYEGDFLKGYPDGKGTMKYADGRVYKGDWRKGEKDGEGVMTMANGEKKEGFWKNDEYQGKFKDPYRIHSSRGIVRASFRRIGDQDNTIELRFRQAGVNAKGKIDQLLLQNSSGSWQHTIPFTGFENVEFPFKGRVDFHAPNQLGTQVSQNVVDFTIYEPGRWEIIFTF